MTLGAGSMTFTSPVFSAGDTSAERVSVSTSLPLEEGNSAGMRKALAELGVQDVFKVRQWRLIFQCDSRTPSFR